MKIFEVVRTDLNCCSGTKIGTTILKRYFSQEKANKFKDDWETRWKKNYDTWNEEVGCSWIDSAKHLEINEVEVE